MLKKLAALLLSLLLCLSLLPGQAHAENLPDPVDPPPVEEPLNPETPKDPDDPPLPMAEGDPDKDNGGHAD